MNKGFAPRGTGKPRGSDVVHDRKGTFKRLAGYVLKEWRLFFLAIALTLLSNQLSLLGPLYSGEAIDAIVAEVFNISRSESRRYFEKELVFINSRVVRKAEKTPEPNDIVSVRGLGRFIYVGIDRTTAKGRLRVSVRRFT